MPLVDIRLEAIVPKGFGLDTRKLTLGMLAGLNHGMSIVLDDFKKTTATWTHKPAWERERAHRSGGEMTAAAGTRDAVYGYVDQGTAPHIIRPKNARNLVFRWGGPGSYRAKTTAGRITSQRGGASGTIRRFKIVNHPGMQARHFAATIAQRRKRNVANLIRMAFMNALRPPGPL